MARRQIPDEGWEIDRLLPDQVDIETVEAFHLGGDRFSASFELSNDRSEFARSFLLDVRYGGTLTFDIRLRIEDSILSHVSLSQDRHLVLELGGIIHHLQPEGDTEVTMKPSRLRRIWALDAGHQFLIGDRGISFLREGGDWQAIEPYGDSLFKSVHGLTPQTIHACGTRGELVRLEGRRWVPLEVPVQTEFKAVHLGEDGSLYLAGTDGQCLAIRDSELIPIANEGWTYIGIAEFKGERYWSDANFGLSIQRGDRLEPFRALGQGFAMHASPDLLVIAGWKEVFIFDGQEWRGFEMGYDGNIFLSALDMTQFGG
ncbi:hypothetical protein [Tabrizicola sp.]|uniref:hypothetical protein n=1 Tax=Tabrizicola sp. TaxID=2005166 RepID=UPI0035B0F119